MGIERLNWNSLEDDLKIHRTNPMIKKFVSNALLSVFMDKKARDKLHAARSKKAAPGNTKSTPSTVADLENQMVGGKDLDGLSKDDVSTLIRASLDQAEREIVDRKAKHAANPQRQALIEQALSVQHSKRHLFKELPPAQQEQLMFMALKTLGKSGDDDNKE